MLKIQPKDMTPLWPALPALLGVMLAVGLRGKPPLVRWGFSGLGILVATGGLAFRLGKQTSHLSSSHKATSAAVPILSSASPTASPPAVPPPKSYLYDPQSTLDENLELQSLVNDLRQLSPMPKGNRTSKAQRGWDAEATRMEQFLRANFGFKNTAEYFVQGVRAFEVDKGSDAFADDHVFTFTDGVQSFRFTASELKQWQDSFQVYYDQDVIEPQQKDAVSGWAQGRAESPQDAWAMKFVVRCSENPILTEFDGNVVAREVGEPSAPIHLLSVCGMDFAGRIHDIEDVRQYVTNWREVYQCNAGVPIVARQRDFIPTGVKAQLNEDLLFNDLKRITLLRLKAADRSGVRVHVDVAIGLGVFAGDAVGCGRRVRELSAAGLKEVLEENRFENIQLVCSALPVFHAGDNLDYFKAAFDAGYQGTIPVLFLDQDMHRLSLAASKRGFTASEVNPADSHGIFGEYWQNRGPGTEEKLAMTTLGLLTQHFALNPHVGDPIRYHAI